MWVVVLFLGIVFKELEVMGLVDTCTIWVLVLVIVVKGEISSNV